MREIVKISAIAATMALSACGAVFIVAEIKKRRKK